MTGFETVLLRVAGTAATTLVRSLLTRAPGAGVTPDPARPAPPWRRPPAELGDSEMRRLTETLVSRLGPECAALPEHERLAVLDAVGDAFAGWARWTRNPSSRRTSTRRPWRPPCHRPRRASLPPPGPCTDAWSGCAARTRWST